MLLIRNEQMKRLGASLRERFEGEMIRHVQKFFPEHCAAMSREELAGVVRQNIERALWYGIASERDVCKFLDIAMALGQQFEGDSRFPWAREILEDGSLRGEGKVERLVAKALEFAGSNGGAHE